MCFFAGHPWKLHSILLLKFDMLQPPSAGGSMKYSNLDGSLDLDGQPVRTTSDSQNPLANISHLKKVSTFLLT